MRNLFKKAVLVLSVSFFSLLLLLSGFSQLYATERLEGLNYNSIGLSPSSGTITAAETPISIVVDSGSTDFDGFYAILSFTGDVEFVRAEAQPGRCAGEAGAFDVASSAGEVEILCLDSGLEPYNGVVVTMYFRATSSGSTSFSFTYQDPSFSSVGSAQYTLDDGTSGDGTTDDGTTDDGTTTTGTTTTSNGGLPDTGIFDNLNTTMIVGFSLILFGFFFGKITDMVRLLPNAFSNAYGSVVSFVDNYQKKKDSNRTQKRRGKLEERF